MIWSLTEIKTNSKDNTEYSKTQYSILKDILNAGYRAYILDPIGPLPPFAYSAIVVTLSHLHLFIYIP